MNDDNLNDKFIASSFHQRGYYVIRDKNAVFRKV